jgi:hypothetical protein
MAKVLEIIHIVKKDTWNELQELRTTCLNLEGEVKAVTARRDLMGQDLVREREWIRILELTLKDHAIAFPMYPFP